MTAFEPKFGALYRGKSEKKDYKYNENNKAIFIFNFI